MFMHVRCYKACRIAAPLAAVVTSLGMERENGQANVGTDPRTLACPAFEDCPRVGIVVYRSVMPSAKPRRMVHLRNGRRFPAQAQLYFSNDKVFGTGTLWNLSRTGARADTTEPVPCGAILTLFLHLPDGGSMVVVDRTRVCWTQGHELGLQILTIEPEDEARLVQFLTALDLPLPLTYC